MTAYKCEVQAKLDALQAQLGEANAVIKLARCEIHPTATDCSCSGQPDCTGCPDRAVYEYAKKYLSEAQDD